MKVLLINICLRPYLKEKYFFPIGLGYVATAIKNAGFDLEILDLDLLRGISEEEKEDLIANISCDVIAMGSIVTGYKKIKDLITIIRKYHNIPIIIGNSVGSSIPEIILRKTDADIVVFEEGEITMVEVLNALDGKGFNLHQVKGVAFLNVENRVHYTEEREMIKDLNTIPFIDYDLFDMEMYIEKFKYTVSEPYPIPFEQIRAFPIIISRGCPFKCTFCYHMFIGKRFRFRSIDNLMKEITMLQQKYNINTIFFADDLSLFSKKQANELADNFMGKGLYWSACCRAGLFKKEDLALLKKMKASGCYSLGYALESANEIILKSMDKRISLEDFEIQTKIMHEAKINTVTSIVIGYPEETKESIQETFDFCKKCSIYPSSGYLTPQPKTIMYGVAKTMGLIQDEEEYLLQMGDRQDFLLNYTNMKKEDIESLVKKNLKEISEQLELGIPEEKLIKMGHIKEKDFS